MANILWIIEKARKFQKNIYFCFIDYTKVFDCVDHNKLWKIVKEMGIPDHSTCLLRNPIDRGAWQALVHGVARVRHDLATKPPWPYLNGLVVFPTFFNLSLNFAIKELTIRATQ